MERHSVSGLALHFVIGSALVLAAYGLTDLVRGGVHPIFLYEKFGAFTLVYLPHGVLVLLAWFYGWMAVPLVLPASMLSIWLLRGSDMLDPFVIMVIVLKVIAAPAAFAIFRLSGVDARGTGQSLNWRILFLIGLVQSLISNEVRFWLGCCGELTGEQMMVAFSGSVFGDMVGLAVVMVAAMLFFKAMRVI